MLSLPRSISLPFAIYKELTKFQWPNPHLFASVVPAVSPCYGDRDSASRGIRCPTTLLTANPSQDDWSPLTASVWWNLLLLPLFREASCLLPLLMKAKSFFLPHTTVARCLRNPSSAPQRGKYMVWTIKGTDCRFTPQTLIGKLHMLLDLLYFLPSYLHLR